MLGWSSDFRAEQQPRNFFDRYADRSSDAEDEYSPLPVGGVRPNYIMSDERRRQMRDEAIASISEDDSSANVRVILQCFLSF